MEGSSFVLETAFHEDEKSNTLLVSQQAVFSEKIIKELREDHAEASEGSARNKCLSDERLLKGSE